jgi:hypothetical protein
MVLFIVTAVRSSVPLFWRVLVRLVLHWMSKHNLLPASRWFLDWLILRPWRWRRHVLPKRRLTMNVLHGVMYQKIEFFITTAVRTSNPTFWFSVQAPSLTTSAKSRGFRLVCVCELGAAFLSGIRSPPSFSLCPRCRLTLYFRIYLSGHVIRPYLCVFGTSE